MPTTNASDFASKFTAQSDIHPAKVRHKATRSKNDRSSKGPSIHPPPGKVMTDQSHQMTNIPELLRRSRGGLFRAQRAAKSLISENREVQFSVNKIKWRKTVCQETLKFSRRLLLDEGNQGREVPEERILARAKIDKCHHGFVRLFQTLFSGLASAVQKWNPPELGDILVHLVKAFIAIGGQQGGRQEKMWLDGLGELQKLLAALDPNQGIECLQDCLKDCEGEGLARYHIYRILFQIVLRQYEDEWIHGRGTQHWKRVLSQLQRSSCMTIGFLVLAQSFPSTPDIITPTTAVAERLWQATRFAEGHHVLSQATEGEVDIFNQATSWRRESQFNRLRKLYSRAHEALKDIDKANSGIALARIGILRWKLFPSNQRSIAIGFLNRALEFENDVDPNTQWLLQAKTYIDEYKAEQKAKEEEFLRQKREEQEWQERRRRELEEERLQKEREEKKQRERRAQEMREMAERAREQKRLDNLEIMRNKGNNVETRDELVGFLEWIWRNYHPPELNSQTQLQEQIGPLKLGRSRSVKLGLKKIIRLYHPDKNANQGEGWKIVSAEVTKVPFQLNEGENITDIILGTKSGLREGGNFVIIV